MKTSSMTFNEITGDGMISRQQTKAYEEGYEKVFGKKESKVETRPVVYYKKDVNGYYTFEEDSENSYDYLSALDTYPKTEYLWKEIVDE